MSKSLTCILCDKQFLKPGNRGLDPKWCSIGCKSKWHRRNKGCSSFGDHLCSCGAKYQVTIKKGHNKGYCSNKCQNHFNRLRNAEYRKKWHRTDVEKYKRKILMHYGPYCACCGEDGFQFLSVDHINGDGAKQKRSNSKQRSMQFYKWIVQNQFPTDLQILCFNCNLAKRTGTACPHQLGTVVRLQSDHPNQLNLFGDNE